jgi:hypothetical protein
MIHEVHLPPLTLKRLTDVVVLQMWLLLYAASHSTLDPTDCANHLDKCPRFRGRGEKIVNWISKASTTRLKPLQDIAEDPAPISDKRRWVKQLISDVFRLLKKPSGTLQRLEPNTRTPWQKAASEFLINFYQEVLRNSTSRFPGYIFSFSDTDENPSAFGAQDFLTEFQKINPKLYICPACDESKYRTKASRIETDIDHYLPKSQYPHLSCHPYNLVPSCSLCNQRMKQGLDPLTGKTNNLITQRRLEDIFNLYRESGLAEKTYLEIKVKNKQQPTRICELKAKENYNLFERIEVIKEIHRIPERWSEQIEEIEDELYRQLENLLRVMPVSLDYTQNLLDYLDYSLSTDYIQGRGKVAFSFAKGWVLATLINDAEIDTSSSVLIKELTSRFGYYLDESSDEISSTASLLKRDKARLSIEEAQKMRQIIKS